MPSYSESHGKKFERRRNQRFPLSLSVEYEVGDHRGRGASTDISSGGLLFMGDRMLPPGSRVRLSVTWPCSLHGTVPLQLVVEGRVLRSDTRGVAVQILRHEFRTKG